MSISIIILLRALLVVFLTFDHVNGAETCHCGCSAMGGAITSSQTFTVSGCDRCTDSICFDRVKDRHPMCIKYGGTVTSSCSGRPPAAITTTPVTDIADTTITITIAATTASNMAASNMHTKMYPFVLLPIVGFLLPLWLSITA